MGVEGCSWLGVLWRVYVPLARPAYVAYALVSASYDWNNFPWRGSRRNAGTLMAVAPLLVAFLLLQRQFMQSFIQAGIQ